MNFELILFCTVVMSGVIALFDLIFLASKRKKMETKKKPLIVNYALSLFPLLLIVFSIRAFAYEPYRIPSGSLKPTLLVGDLILVNKFDYGIRLPVIHTKILSLNEPQRGDIVVFHKPPEPSINLIKRVIGVPGDHVTYINKVLYINGQEIPQQFVRYSTDQDNQFGPWLVVQKQENLFGVQHCIYQITAKENDDFDVVVPKGNYFMMGDNRDDSADSRAWGFMPEENIIGKATNVFMSVDTTNYSIRWSRIGEKII